MNATMKALTAELATLERQRGELAAKLRSTDPVAQQAEQAQAAIQAAATKRRSLLGRVFLGEAADIAKAEAELNAAQQQAAELATTAEGAAAARELIQSEIDNLNRRTAKIRVDMEVAKWEAARAEVSKLASAYRTACEAAEAAYLELIGAAQVTDSLRPVESTPRCYSAVAPAALTFPTQPLPELEGFQRHRDIYTHHTRAQLEAAALARFCDAGILEGAA
ncbi:MAG: hypothetical protein K8I04_11080 [Gammaproteobacteria bacterium]|nr:hypothetical protein [Gammaproteobacteria bacterium]